MNFFIKPVYYEEKFSKGGNRENIENNYYACLVFRIFIV